MKTAACRKKVSALGRQPGRQSKQLRRARPLPPGLCCSEVTEDRRLLSEKSICRSSRGEKLRPALVVGGNRREVQRFPQFATADLLIRVRETLNWRKFPRLKNGNWFERRARAYCQISTQQFAREQQARRGVGLRENFDPGIKTRRAQLVRG